MASWIWFHIKRWVFTIFLIFAIAALGRQAQLVLVQGASVMTITNAWSDVFVAIVKSPFQLLSPPYHQIVSDMFHHIPASLYFVLYALIGSYLFGTMKGIADVFWQRRPAYRFVQGIAWLLDAVPMFGLIVILSMGSLYLAMAVKDDPVKMLPNKAFWTGDFLRGNILMLAPMMYISRIVSISISTELGEEYLLTARGMGAKKFRLFFWHLFRNILPKLINEMSTVFVMILSSLLALEYLTFREHGAMFGLVAAMGQGELGQQSLYIDQSPFYVQTVTGYLLLIALFMTAFQLFSEWLKWRWRVKHSA